MPKKFLGNSSRKKIRKINSRKPGEILGETDAVFAQKCVCLVTNRKKKWFRLRNISPNLPKDNRMH